MSDLMFILAVWFGALGILSLGMLARPAADRAWAAVAWRLARRHALIRTRRRQASARYVAGTRRW